MTAQASWLPDGRRLHLNHGPIDLIVEAWGEAEEVRRAYGQAVERFQTILTELVAELPELRKAVRDETPPAAAFLSPTARRMHAAVLPFAPGTFITPMAAVAGAVADEMLAALVAGRRLDKAYVNNGGDIALHLAPGASLQLAVAGVGNGFGDRLAIPHRSPIRGVATSGWRGRSFSLGIADAVTVLARDAAAADAAATIVANAVDLPGHAAIARRPARQLQPDTDLGDRMVTTGVGRLSAGEVEAALDAGMRRADELLGRGLLDGAVLFLAGTVRVVGAGARALVTDNSEAGVLA